jgi:transmembrane sensor
MSSENRKRTIIAEEAADWFVANREGIESGEQRRFAAWLKASPVHVEEYLGIAQLAGDLREAVADPALSLDALLEKARAADGGNVRLTRPSRAPRTIPRGPWMYAAAAGVLLAVGLAFLWSSTLRMPSEAPVAELRFATGHGEQLAQTLADGSVLRLNTDTQVAVRYERTSRWIALERGQAVFEVAHDPNRPFRVIAGTAEVVAVGTKFDVYLQPGSTLVTVVEGRVTVGSIAELSSAEIKRAGTRGTIAVGAGQQVRVADGQLPSGTTQIDARRATAWLRRQIEFDHEPLAVVAAEFNRYIPTPIDIDTPALRDVPISGVFAEDDADSFVTFLRSLDGVRVEVTSTRIRVSKIQM